MDTRTGNIYTAEEMDGIKRFLSSVPERTLADAMMERFAEMNEPPTAAQMRRVPPQVKGHERCPCGSGRQFKNCCKS